MLTRILITLVVFGVLFTCEKLGYLECFPWYINFVIFLIPYLLIGYDIIFKAARNICHGQIFDENFLMMLATFGALGVGEYSEAVAVMLFYQVGELFQGYAVGKSRQSISDMMDICPEYANVEQEGKMVQVDPDDVEIGTVITVKPGERIPLDGVVLEGESLVDTAALTGESVPRKVKPGENIISGCVNGSGTLKVKTTKEFDDSTVAKILELVENASSKKAKVENFITRFAKYYTPVVTIAAVLLAFVPPIFVGNILEWIQRACIFLVISCPCALVISVPLGFFGGIGAASKLGVLVKGSNFLEAVAEMDTIVFDKTGTLTKGVFKVTSTQTVQGEKEDELVETAALAEGYSNHPIANSIREAYGRELDLSRVDQTTEIAGHGIAVLVDGRKVLVGNEKLMKKEGIDFVPDDHVGTVVYVAKEGRLLGSVCISEAISQMKEVGVKKCIMLTGDREEAAADVAQKLGLDEYHAGLLPGDKVDQVEKLLASKSENSKLAFVGDGINDAPVLTRADVGIAMGSLGSDAAIEAADVVLMDDDIQKIASVVKISRKTLKIVKQNIVFALAVKAVVLIMGALGLANMWEAVFADVGVSVLAILNAMRALKYKG